jgi:hypothetical protein
MLKSGFLKEGIAKKIYKIILQAFLRESKKLYQMAYEFGWLAMPREDVCTFIVLLQIF